MLATCICLNGSLLDQLSCTIVYLHNLFTCTFGRINMSVCLSVCLSACRCEYHSRPDSHHWTCHPGHTAGQLRQLDLADPDHSSQTRGNAPCLMLYTTSPTRQSEQRNNWSRLSLYGLAYGSKSASGRKIVFVVKRPKYIDALPPQWTSLCLRHAVSITSTST